MTEARATLGIARDRHGRQPARCLRSRDACLFAALTVLLWVATVRMPAPPETALDPSWQEMLVRGWVENWQYGPDFAFTYGPLGFFVTDYHLGAEGAVARLLGLYFGQLVFAAAIIWLLGAITLWRRVLLVLAVAALHTRHWSDGPYLLFIALVVVRRLIPGEEAARSGAWAGALAFFAHVKFSFAVLGLAGVGLAVLVAALRRRWTVALGIGAGYGLAFLGFWLLAGQALTNLPPYLVNALEIIKGYDMMALDEPVRKTLAGAALVGWCGFVLLAHLRKNRDLGTLATVVFLGALGFMLWKHAFTRAGAGHMGSLPITLVYLTVTLAAYFSPEGKFHRLDYAWVAGFAALGLGLLGSWEFLSGTPRRLRENVTGLARGPGLTAKWQAELATVRDREALAARLGLVGRGSVDVYDFNQGVALLQSLNFRPRPVPQGYTVYTPRLGELNRRHYAGDRAPDFVLWRMGTIDARFPSQDDASLFPIVWERYRVDETMGDYLLLKKEAKSRLWSAGEHTFLRRSLRLGETLELPTTAADAIIWLKLKATPTFPGRLRKLAYKPATLFMHTEEQVRGREEWRILTRVAEDPGFLLQPVLTSNVEFADFMKGEVQPPIQRISFSAPPRQGVFWSTLEVELTIMPRRRATR